MEKTDGYKIMRDLYYILTFLCFLTLNNNISSHVPGRLKYMLTLIFIYITILLFLSRGKRKINRNLIFFFISSLYPFIIILFFSTIGYIYSDNIRGIFTTRNLFTLSYFVIPVLQMICVVYLFKENAINITFYATSISYTYNIYLYIKMFKLDGIIYFYKYFNSFRSPLEAHELIFTVGLYFIYYLLFENKYEKNHRLKLFICIFIMTCGLKRIQIISILITLFLYYIVKITNKKRNMTMYGYIGVLLCFIYILLIRSRFLDYISTCYDINFMSRLQAYDYFIDKYSISLFYFGKGIDYVNNTLSSVGNLLYGIGDLHNDILKYYIELGFIGSMALFINYLVMQPKRLLKIFGIQVAKLYLILTFFTFIIFCSDNVSRYSQYILSYSMIPFAYWIKVRSLRERTNIKGDDVKL